MNILSPFDYHKPTTKAEALDLLATLDNVKVIAGGTDLVLQMKEKLVTPDHIVDITGIDEFKGIKLTSGKGGVIGACTTLATCEFSEELKAKYPAFAYACGELAGPQIREMATIGGNLSHSSPSAETPCSLIAYGAVLTLESKSGSREVAVKDFIKGNRENELKKGELVTQITFPEPKANTVVKYGYVGLRSAMEIDMANMGISLTVEGGVVKEAFCVMGSVAIKPLISEKIPGILEGKKIDDALLKEASEATMSEAKPITDVRASAEYRKDVVGALTRRLFKEAYAELTK